MKYEYLFFMFFVFTSVTAQTVDSTVIKQVDSLLQVSGILAGKREYDKALEVNTIAEKLALENLGRESVTYGSCCFNRGKVNYYKRDFQEAEKGYLEATAIQKRVLGKEHPIYASSLGNLAVLYFYMGNYEKVEPLLLEALFIREKAKGKENDAYALSLNNLASLYWMMGNYEKAESHYLEALAIREIVLGKEHPEYAKTLGNLAVLYKEMRNYEKAEILHLETIAILEKALGKEDPDYASNLGNLAVLYMEMREYKKAELLHFEAKALREKMQGKDHPNYAHSLNDLANTYYAMGEYEKAEPFFIESRVIRERVQGKEHPEYASSLNNLGGLYRKMGLYDKVEPLYLESLSIRERVLGKEHPHYAISLNNLSILYTDLGNYEKAEPLFIELSTVKQSLLERAVRHLSERELGNYLIQFTSSQDQTLSFAHLSGSKKVAHSCYNNALFYKGFLLQAAGQLKRLANSDPATTDQFNLLKSYERRLAAQYAQPRTKRDNAKIGELETNANNLEKDLAKQVAGFANANRQVKCEEVKSALNPGEMAVEFINYRFNQTNLSVSTLYAALVLLPGLEQPLFIPLFEEKEFVHLLDANIDRKADYVNELYAWADRGMVKLGVEKKSLYDLIWAKIEAVGLEGINTVFYSPSGVLHRLNLGALAVDNETILSDRYNLIVLNSTRQLVIPSTAFIQANDALLVGGVNFEMDTTETQVTDPLLISSSTADAWTESGKRGGNWSYLNWTEKEVKRIATSLATGGFNVTQLKGTEATEEAIKTIGTEAPSPRVLHIATHGFFFPDPEHKTATSLDDQSVFKWSDNPMIRSGLILAGGNYAWQNGMPVSPDREDGILTAYEISQMNLSNTELVVLSACETGLGDIQGNEGVYGLQRAFKIAGAKYLIMSLWQVPDRETMEFMTAFYKNWLPSDAEALAGKEGKMTIPDAFRKTQREMRDRFYNPYSWAGFVLVE